MSLYRLLLAACLLLAPVAGAFAQTVTKAGGDAQDGLPNTALPLPLSVRLIGGDPKYTYAIVWKVTSGEATFLNGSSGQTQTSIAPNQQASVRVRLGATPGPVTIVATATQTPPQCSSGTSCTTPIGSVTFIETIDAPPQLIKVSGDAQSGAPNSTLAQPLVVRAVFSGSTQSSVDLVWQVVAGDARFAASATTTLQQVVAVNTDVPVTLVLGATPGPVQIHVACARCGNDVDFSTTIAVASQPQLIKISGDAQTGATNATGASPLVVQLLDANGQPFAGQSVTWQVLQGQLALDATTTATDAQGNAQTTFRYGNAAGPISVRASAAGQSVDFSLSSFVPALRIVSGDAQAAPPGTMLPQPLTVQIAATGGGTTALQGVTIIWSVLGGGGYLASSTSRTDATGRSSNTLTLGPTPGSNRVQAALANGGAVVFSATATVIGAKLSIVSGNGQALPTYQPSQPLVVRVTDAQDKPLAGVSVQWSASPHSVVNPATSVTDAGGLASSSVTIQVPGSASVTAQTVGITTVPVTFALNGGVANIPGLTPTQRKVAVAIDHACAAFTLLKAPIDAAQADLFARCTELVKNAGANPQPVARALDALAGDTTTPQTTIALSLQQAQLDNLNQRLFALRHGAHGATAQGLSLASGGHALSLAQLGDAFDKAPAEPEAGAAFTRWGFFVTGNYTHGSGDARSERPGFDFDNAALTAGVDYRFSDRFVAGAALGYGHNSSSTNANRGSTSADAYNLSAYATWYRGEDFYVNAAASFGWADYSLSRSIVYQIASDAGTTDIRQVANASPGGDQRAFVLALGKDFHRDAWEWNPELRLDYKHVTLDAFNETLRDGPGSGLGLHVADRTQTDLLGILGARLSYTLSRDWGVLIPNAQIEWNHEFNRSANNVTSWFLNDPTATPILLSDPRSNTNFFTLSLGLNALWPNGRSGFILLEHVSAQQGVSENRLSIGAHLEF